MSNTPTALRRYEDTEDGYTKKTGYYAYEVTPGKFAYGRDVQEVLERVTLGFSHTWEDTNSDLVFDGEELI